MICPNCGASLNEQTKFCTNCGASLTTAQPAEPEVTIQTQTPAQAQVPLEIPSEPAPAPVQVKEEIRPTHAPIYSEPSSGVKPHFQTAPANLKEFVLQFGDEKTQRTMRFTSTALYILAGINAVFGVLAGTFPFDAVLLAVMGFWYQKEYSNTCAVVFLAYAVLSMVLSLLLSGTISGWLILILAVLVFSTTQKAQKAFEQYRKTGQNPLQ